MKESKDDECWEEGEELSESVRLGKLYCYNCVIFYWAG